ncbi:MAG TPA: hypothetical protein PLZ43_14010 [bacterium]|nr:hypothetical protein [bacterium]
MKKSRIVFFLILSVVVVIAVAIFRNGKNEEEKSGKMQKTVSESSGVERSVSSKLSLALGRAMKNAKPEELEKLFNEKTELTPLQFDEVEKLEGDGLQKRVVELDVKLDHAIQTNPDLPPPPEWYLKEREYLNNKFFATIGKSKYQTELTEEQKEKQQKYLNYLEEIKKTGEAVSDEQLAKIKEQILGE